MIKYRSCWTALGGGGDEGTQRMSELELPRTTVVSLTEGVRGLNPTGTIGPMPLARIKITSCFR